MTLRLDGPSGDSFTLEYLDRRESDFLDVRVTARSNWFKVDFFERFLVGEVEDWAEGLRRLHREMAGSYVFRAMQGWLQVTFAMGKKGELHVSILLQNAPDYLNEVRLFLNLDQSYLPQMADDIAAFGKV